MNLTMIGYTNTYLTKLWENDGVITEEIEAIEQDLVRKTDACAYVLDELKARKQFLHEKEAEIYAAKKSVESAIERISSGVKESMAMLKTGEIRGDLYRFVCSNIEKRIDIVDRELIPKEFKSTKLVEIIETDKIKEAFAEGYKIPGAVEAGGTKLNYYVIRAKKPKQKSVHPGTASTPAIEPEKG